MTNKWEMMLERVDRMVDVMRGQSCSCETYVRESAATANNDMDGVRERLEHDTVVRLLHAGMGISTEAGEFLDSLKKRIYYGKELDVTNLAEELGDVVWYVGEACRALGISLDDVFAANLAKLHKRYGGEFSESSATTRDLDAERKTLEENLIDDWYKQGV